jgi:hypothetical protein
LRCVEFRVRRRRHPQGFAGGGDLIEGADMTACELPRPVALADTPHTRIDDDMRAQRDQITTLDLAGCNITYVNVRLQEHEKPGGQRFEQWPLAVRVIMEKEVAAFIERNAGATVRAVTTGVGDRVCVLGIHWKPKS